MLSVHISIILHTYFYFYNVTGLISWIITQTDFICIMQSIISHCDKTKYGVGRSGEEGRGISAAADDQSG